MIPLPVPNTRAHPYRGLSVQEIDFPLTETAILDYLRGREVYRRTDFLALRHEGQTALVTVRKASVEPLFSPVTEARLLSGPDDTAWVTSPQTDVGNATALAAAADPRARASVVVGAFEHVNFIWEPAPIPVRVTEVVPPAPGQARRPGRAGHRLRRGSSAGRPGPRPGRRARPGRGQPVPAVPAAVPGRRHRSRCPGGVPRHPARAAWRLDAHRLRAVPAVPPALLRRRAAPGRRVPAGSGRDRRRHRPSGTDGRVGVTLTKCCLIERGLQVDGDMVVVPWGTNLDEIREGLRQVLLPLAPEAVQGHAPSAARPEEAART